MENKGAGVCRGPSGWPAGLSQFALLPPLLLTLTAPRSPQEKQKERVSGVHDLTVLQCAVGEEGVDKTVCVRAFKL